jgi:protein-S-isoprenylcysteine O-methyltransferase Ste14
LTPLEQFISIVVSLSVVSVLFAVVLSFSYRSREVDYNEQPCPVATFTMVLFFVGYYLLIRFRVGSIDVRDGLALALAIVGLPLVVIGAAVNLLGRKQLGSNWADQATLYANQSLVTTGLFGYVRHPLYASLIWMFIGAGLSYHNVVALLATFVVFVPAMIWRANLEEKMLALRFPEYAEYQKHAGRLIPWRRRG